MKSSFLSILLIFFSIIGGVIGAAGYSYILKNYDIFEFLSDSQTISNKNITTLTTDLTDLQSNITTLARDVSPSVVSIVIKKDLVVYRSDPWGFFQQPAGTISRQVGGGSGFFITKNGTILTNKHVVADNTAAYTVITNDGIEYDAEVLATDPINDLAVIQIINSQNNNFNPLPFISSAEEINIGEFAIAVGNALAEFQNSVSLGIISGKERSIEASGQSLTGLIQTDAAINPGNSGGPLIDLSGRVIGINTAIASNSNGIGFSIALSQEKIDYILKSITESGKIKRPFIGINYIQNSQGVASELGLETDIGAYIIDEVDSIVVGSSAERAGLRPGDIILEINEKEINSNNTLQNIIQNSIPGETLRLVVLKKSGEQEEIELDLGEF
ncbi:trypsin-like serine protease [Candidatus Gracilibacteria bacterium]|nr:trypsin-like serine protease [Candidatus Gracilibacteria bacterium]